jgi:hypothetical protein
VIPAARDLNALNRRRTGLDDAAERVLRRMAQLECWCSTATDAEVERVIAALDVVIIELTGPLTWADAQLTALGRELGVVWEPSPVALGIGELEMEQFLGLLDEELRGG